MTAETEPSDGLDAAEIRAVEALAAGSTLQEAARAARVSERTLRRWRCERRAFRRAMSEASETTFEAVLAGVRALAVSAIEALRSVLDDPTTPAHVRVSAARVVLDHATRAWDLTTRLEPRPLDPLEEVLGDWGGR